MESLCGFLNEQFIKIESLNEELQLDLGLESHKEFFKQVKKCITLNENDELLFNRNIYNQINWGREEVEIFNYAISLLKTDLVLAEKLFTFFSNLEQKNKIFWDEYYRGHEFYPLLLFYMINFCEIDEFNFCEEDDVLRNFFMLESENVGWIYFEENLNIDYLGLDYYHIISILETIINGITIKNKSFFTILKSIINNNISKIKNEYEDEDEETESQSDIDIPADSQRDVDILNDLKQEIERLESHL